MKYLVVGLGNIGAEYENTRHNIGFDVVDYLAKQAKTLFVADRYASIVNIKVKNKSLLLIKPSTYMNLSGKAISYWQKKENINITNIIVIVDDISLPLGILRLKPRGSDGGHNGLISIIESLQTTDFARLRVGIGDDFPKGCQSDYVLGKWSKQESLALQPRIEVAAEIVKCFALAGIANTMNTYNNK